MQSSTTTPPPYHFGQALINEIIEFSTSHLAGLPCSVVFVVMVFMLDTTLRSSTAKLYFVCGYIIEFMLFYAFSVVCFPRSNPNKMSRSSSRSSSGNNRVSASSSIWNNLSSHDDYDDLIHVSGGRQSGGGTDNENMLQKVRFLAQPFQLFTDASFFNFSAGYVLGYWGNLNILTDTPNATVVNAYYAAFVLFCYLYSVFYLQGATSWHSGLVSVVVGVIGGMICSSTIASRVKLEAQYDSLFVTTETGEGGASTDGSNHQINGATMCDRTSNSEDMVCKVFQASG